jgi:hypothetical protein
LRQVNRLLIIGGTGRNSGKTTFAKKLIEKYAGFHLTAVKITPHPHPDKSGLIPIIEKEEYTIFEEYSMVSQKDTSCFLAAGAEHVYLIIAAEQFIKPAFETLLSLLPSNTPVICESPALRRYFKPDLLIVMHHDNNQESDSKDITDILTHADLVLTLGELSSEMEASITMNRDGGWEIKKVESP